MPSAAGEIFDEHDGDALAIAAELVAARAEVAFWRRQDTAGPIHDARDTEIGNLRARDEKAQAVVQWWTTQRRTAPDEGGPLLDALAAEYEDGGRDR